MGYYTVYTMNLLDPVTQKELSDKEYEVAKAKVVELIQDYDVACYALGENLDGSNEAKWYEYDKDMTEISKQIPNVLLCVHGEGETSGDVWNHYFLNGKSQFCHAEIPPFNPELLE